MNPGLLERRGVPLEEDIFEICKTCFFLKEKQTEYRKKKEILRSRKKTDIALLEVEKCLEDTKDIIRSTQVEESTVQCRLLLSPKKT